MPNERNLIPFTSEQSREEAKKNGALGGVASGVSRRRKRRLKEAADLYLSLPPADKRRWNKISRQGVDPEEIDNQMAMIVGLTERAIKGDAKAAKVIIDLLGDGENEREQGLENNLLEAIKGLGEIDTSDLPEVQ